MDEKLSQIEEKYERLTAQMNAPEIYSDAAKYAALAKEQKELEPVVEAWREVIDELECICDHDYWPVPTYNDILFYA